MTFDADKRAGTLHGRARRHSAAVSFAALAGLIAVLLSQPALSAREEGAFPTADEVGGDVFPKGLQVGEPFPTDIELYDSKGRPADLGKLIKGKRSVLALFISAVPASVEELRKLEKSVDTSKTQLLFLNTDQVGTALHKGDKIVETARTLRVIRHEKGLKSPMFVAPNDVYAPEGLSNRLGIRGLPTVVLLSADGKVEDLFIGPQNWDQKDI